MGNSNSTSDFPQDCTQSRPSKSSRSKPSISTLLHYSQSSSASSTSSTISSNIDFFLKNTDEKKEDSAFFIKHHKMYNISHKQIDVSTLDQNRLVFVSVYGLYRSWQQCPPILLYNSIFILPLKQEWIEKPAKYQHAYSSLLADKKFVDLLTWKLSQNLAFCMKDDDEKDNKFNFVSQKWIKISSKLASLYDPVNECKYNALMFDENYWKHDSSCSMHKSHKFHPSYQDILVELYLVGMNFRAMTKLLTENNPTLRVITFYYSTNISTAPVIYNNMSDHALDVYTPNSLRVGSGAGDQYKRSKNNDDPWNMSDDYFEDDCSANRAALDEFYDYLHAYDHDENEDEDKTADDGDVDDGHQIQSPILMQTDDEYEPMRCINYTGIHCSSFSVSNQRFSPI